MVYTLIKHYMFMSLNIYIVRGQSALFRTLLAMKHEYGYWFSPSWFTPDNERFFDRVERPLLVPDVDQQLIAAD
jgi:hypothetical protein